MSFPYDNNLIQDTRFDTNVMDKYDRIKDLLNQQKPRDDEISVIKCTGCRQEKLSYHFVNIRNGRMTKTCLDCRIRRRKSDVIHKAAIKKAANTSQHLSKIRQEFSVCVDCKNDFSDINHYRKQRFFRKDHNQDIKYYKFNSIPRLNAEIHNYDVICNECYCIRNILFD